MSFTDVQRPSPRSSKVRWMPPFATIRSASSKAPRRRRCRPPSCRSIRYRRPSLDCRSNRAITKSHAHQPAPARCCQQAPANPATPADEELKRRPTSEMAVSKVLTRSGSIVGVSGCCRSASTNGTNSCCKERWNCVKRSRRAVFIRRVVMWLRHLHHAFSGNTRTIFFAALAGTKFARLWGFRKTLSRQVIPIDVGQ